MLDITIDLTKETIENEELKSEAKSFFRQYWGVWEDDKAEELEKMEKNIEKLKKAQKIFQIAIVILEIFWMVLDNQFCSDSYLTNPEH